MKSIGIFSLELDLHANAVYHAINASADTKCHFFATDSQPESGGVSWSQGDVCTQLLRSYDSEWIDSRSLDLVWWRRPNQPQKPQLLEGEETADRMLNLEWNAAIFGLMISGFEGVWVNDPAAESWADNKLNQLRAAASVGFKVPRTLVSSDPERVLEFCQELGGELVVKRIVGNGGLTMANGLVRESDLTVRQQLIRRAPAIYQEHIPGKRYIRANCFGSRAHCYLVESDGLDWRRDLSRHSVVPYAASPGLELGLTAMLGHLGLEMAAVDLMISENEDIIWLGLKPQGQFLFSEGPTWIETVSPFATFLEERAVRDRFSLRPTPVEKTTSPDKSAGKQVGSLARSDSDQPG